jgi:hypothetical protein
MGKPYGTIEELAAAEKINASYVSRILRLTLLAPDIVEWDTTMPICRMDRAP